ncbi:hypothetical protein ACSSV4_001870 [Roseovarius sp. MBR-154]
MRHFTSIGLPIFRSTIVDAVTSGLYPGCQPLSPLEAVMTAATGCNASARVSALVPSILKRLMTKRTQSPKADVTRLETLPSNRSEEQGNFKDRDAALQKYGNIIDGHHLTNQQWLHAMSALREILCVIFDAKSTFPQATLDGDRPKPDDRDRGDQ